MQPWAVEGDRGRWVALPFYNWRVHQGTDRSAPRERRREVKRGDRGFHTGKSKNPTRNASCDLSNRRDGSGFGGFHASKAENPGGIHDLPVWKSRSLCRFTDLPLCKPESPGSSAHWTK